MQSLGLKGSNVSLSDNLSVDLEQILLPYGKSKIFVLTDEGTFKHCFKFIEYVNGIDKENVIIIKQGDINKNIEAVADVWKFLVNGKADRHSVLLNLGGGMPCDLGGFAASTFKRGIPFINIPTTLLAQVDASVGGKTGVNFMGFKNEVGIIRQAEHVLLNISLLETLDNENMLSGFAEMIKHALLKDNKTFEDILNFDILNPDMPLLGKLVAESVVIKDYYVSNDPLEKNIRKALNLGHTIGHAFESFALYNRPILHGYAVAFGLVVELYLSHLILGFDIEIVNRLAQYVKRVYGTFPFNPSNFEILYETMTHDKKNSNGQINFALLKRTGEIVIDINCEKGDVWKAFECYLLNGTLIPIS